MRCASTLGNDTQFRNVSDSVRRFCGIRPRPRRNLNGRLRWRWFSGNLPGRRSDEAVAMSGQCLDIARSFRIVAERNTDLVYAKIDAMFVIDECVVTPEAVLNLFSGDNLSRVFR